MSAEKVLCTVRTGRTQLILTFHFTDVETEVWTGEVMTSHVVPC